MAKAKDKRATAEALEDNEPVVTSGLTLLKMLKESGTGQDKLNIGLMQLPKDRKGQPAGDCDAKLILEAFEESADVDDGSVDPRMVVPELTREKAKQFYYKGKYDPLPQIDPNGIEALLEKFQPEAAKKFKKAEKVEEKPKWEAGPINTPPAPKV